MSSKQLPTPSTVVLFCISFSILIPLFACATSSSYPPANISSCPRLRMFEASPRESQVFDTPPLPDFLFLEVTPPSDDFNLSVYHKTSGETLASISHETLRHSIRDFYGCNNSDLWSIYEQDEQCRAEEKERELARNVRSLAEEEKVEKTPVVVKEEVVVSKATAPINGAAGQCPAMLMEPSHTRACQLAINAETCIQQSSVLLAMAIYIDLLNIAEWEIRNAFVEKLLNVSPHQTGAYIRESCRELEERFECSARYQELGYQNEMVQPLSRGSIFTNCAQALQRIEQQELRHSPTGQTGL